MACRLAVPPALEPPPAVGVLPAQPSTVLPPLWPATARDSTHIRMMEWLREDPPSVQSQCSHSAVTVQSECLYLRDDSWFISVAATCLACCPSVMSSKHSSGVQTTISVMP